MSTLTSTLETVSVPYQDWHPAIDDRLWERLEIPGHHNNGRYKDKRLFEKKDYWNANAIELISTRQILEYYLSQNRVAFVVEHYLSNHQEIEKTKILEVGCWPMKNYTVSPQFSNTLLALLSQNNNNNNKIVVEVDSISITGILPYKTLTLPYFGNGIFVQGDFHEKSVRSTIEQKLDGKPNIIVGNMVFEKRLGTWMAGNYFGITLVNLDQDHHVAEQLLIRANNFLDQNGTVVICNRGYGQIPEFAKTMPLAAVYLDEKGKEYAQVRGKVL